MKKIKLVSAIFLSTVLIASVFTGCGEKKEALTKVRLNEVVHSVFYAPQYVALEKGFFEEEGLDIELSVGQGADKSMTALISNSADIALLGTEAGIYVYNEGKENYAVSFAQLKCFRYIILNNISSLYYNPHIFLSYPTTLPIIL